MPCYHPIKGWRSKARNVTGKRSIVFDRSKGYSDLPVTLPCGRCWGCRLERSRVWATRIMHEASLHKENCFITLTYNNKNVSEDGSLIKQDFVDFMKRLRERVKPVKIRFFQCGEYGDRYNRPHHHACIFGYDFNHPDYPLFDIGKGGLKSSRLLDEVWGKGYTTIGDLTFESAAYVARYIMKKFLGKEVEKDEHYVDKKTGVIREAEYVTMSRGGSGKDGVQNGGIGKGWFDKYYKEVYNTDSVIVRGHEVKPPKYYDKLYDVIDEGAMTRIRAKRKKLDERRIRESTPERLQVREQVAIARINLYPRGIE